MRPPFVEAFFRTSSPEVAPPTSNSDPDGAVNIPWEHSVVDQQILRSNRTLKTNTFMMPSSGYIAHELK